MSSLESHSILLSEIESVSDDHPLYNAACTIKALRQYVPSVDLMIEELADFPVNLVFTTGQVHQNGQALYSDHTLKMQVDSFDIVEEVPFIKNFAHELTHALQDKRGVFRSLQARAEGLDVSTIVFHCLLLEGAAHAQEATVMYELSSRMQERDSEGFYVSGYFDEYLEYYSDQSAYWSVELAQDPTVSLRRLKGLWSGAFINFFSPDNPKAEFYINKYASDFLKAHRANPDLKLSENFSCRVRDHMWGTVKAMKVVTDIPGYGQVFTAGALEPVRQSLLQCITFSKYQPLYDLVRSQIVKPQDALQFLQNLEP